MVPGEFQSDVLVLLDPHVSSSTIALPFRSSRPGDGPPGLCRLGSGQDDSRGTRGVRDTP